MQPPTCLTRTLLASLIVVAGALSTSTVASAASSQPSPLLRDGSTPLTSAEHSQLNARLTQIAREVLAHVDLLPGQSRQGSVTAVMDLDTNMITVSFQRMFLPDERDALLLEDQLDAFRHALTWEAWKFRAPRGVIYLWQGRSLEEYFPTVREEADRARERSEAASKPHSGSGMAMVAAGHGFYLLRASNRWDLQRPLSLGIQEDFLTVNYAEELQRWIELRSHMPVELARSTSQLPHPASGHAWWKIAARYHLEKRYPQNPEIWGSLGVGTTDDHDYKEDIRSRPLLANHQRAEIAVHLHTNAAGPAASGARVIYQPGRDNGRRLAESVLCYMKETIHAVEAYDQFIVSSHGEPADKGENRLADMPSIIVETAFHTNASDALALQDPVFRTASMKGVEKGVRLFRQGKACQPFSSMPMSDLEIDYKADAAAQVGFAGFPQFPVTLTAKVVVCPSGWICFGSNKRFEELMEGSLPLTTTCSNQSSKAARLTWDITLKDADGVTTAPQRFSFTCKAKPSAGRTFAAPSATLS